MNVSLSPSAPVVTYKKVYSKFIGDKVTRVFVDGTAKYDIFRFSPFVKGFECYTLDANVNGQLNDFFCGGQDVLLREVKEMVEAEVLKAYNKALNDASTDIHKQAVDRYVHAMTDATYAIEDVAEDKAVVSLDGEEVAHLLHLTFIDVHQSNMTTPDGTQALQDLTNAAKAVYEAQQRLKEATEALQALRDRATSEGKA